MIDREKKRARDRRYRATAKGKASRLKYECSCKARDRYRRYNHSERGQQRRQRWEESLCGVAHRAVERRMRPLRCGTPGCLCWRYRAGCDENLLHELLRPHLERTAEARGLTMLGKRGLFGTPGEYWNFLDAMRARLRCVYRVAPTRTAG